MANKPQLKAVGEQDFSESDPFAELTRIMGFDPRVQPTPRPEDDFQIDLEKELMGEFDRADEHEEAPRQADPFADHREASRTEDAQPVSQAVSSPPADDLEDALTSVFQQELGEESAQHAFPDRDSPNAGKPDGGGDQTAFLPREQEAAAATGEQHLSPVGEDAPADRAEDASSVRELSSGEAEAPEDKGPEFAESLNRLLSDAGYKSGSSYSGTAQVYQISTSYVTAPPAAESPAVSTPDEAQADEPAAIASDRPEQVPASMPFSSTVFGTTRPQEHTGASPSEPAGSDAPPAFDASFQEMEAEAGVHSEPAASFAPESSLEAEEVEEPEDPFAALAALGSETPAQNLGGETHPPAAGPVPLNAISETRRFEGAARFYSSLDLFSRATPVAPGMRQPPRVPALARQPEQEAVEPALTEDKEVFSAGATDAAEHEAGLADRAKEAQDDIPADIFEAAMLDDGVAAAEADDAAQPAAPAQADARGASARESRAAPASMPDIETIDVPEPAVAIVDDLDIPTPPIEETPPPAAAFDDLDQEFVAAFSDLRNEGRKASEQTTPSNEDDELTARIEELFSSEFDFSDHEPPARAGAAAQEPATTAPVQNRASAEGAYAPEHYAFEEEYYDDAATPAYADAPEEPAVYPSSRLLAVRDRRGPMVAALIGCVVIAGAAGAFAYSHHAAKDSGPVLLKADAQPVKMKPKHPGGTKVPNQDNQVYKRVADGDIAQPVQQQKLVSSEEKPVDLAAQANAASNAASSLPGVDMPKIPQASSQEITALAKGDAGQPQKNQDRVPPSHAAGADISRADDVIAVEPRKVRTMIVKPDGTMVPTPLPAATPAAAPRSVATAALEEPAVKAPAGAKPVAASENFQKPASRAGVEKGSVVTPQHVDIAPSRPAVQPVSIKQPAGTELKKNEKVASLEAAPVRPAAAAGWAMQIASQPTAQAAQTSYQHLAHRFGSVLGGHGVDIVKAEIAGKGTYYRVRVPASTRDEAIALCTKYKAAGGNCFVSK